MVLFVYASWFLDHEEPMRDMLSGVLPVKETEERLRSKGFSDNAIKGARKQLGAQTGKSGYDGCGCEAKVH